MIRWLFLTLSLLLGFDNNAPKYDLHKKTTKEESTMKLINWFYMNLDFIALAALILALVVFLLVCFSIGGTESGIVYNQFDKVI